MDNIFIETNADLNNLAYEVLKNYAIIPQNISVVQGGTIKTVWKVNTQNNTFCLKRLKQSYDKALFSVNAQIFIRNAGGNVPAIILDKDNQALTRYKEQLFTVYEWIQGENLDFGKPKDLNEALTGLAKFHIASKGYSPVEDSRTSTKLGKWPEQYASMRDKMIAWKEISKNNLSVSANATYLKYVDSIVDISNTALALLESSKYMDLTLKDLDVTVLCHQDYGKGNALLTESGVIVLDLDGVTFDLPARDLRKIIGKNAENKGLWDIGTINNIVECYTKVNRMDEQEKKVLYIDLLFPHWFFGLVKNQFLNNKQLKSGEIERIAKLEQAKLPVLSLLLKIPPL